MNVPKLLTSVLTTASTLVLAVSCSGVLTQGKTADAAEAGARATVNTEYSLTGFATGLSLSGLPTTPNGTTYRQVTTAAQLGLALKKNSGVKVVEIMNDLALGWNEIGSAAQTSPFASHAAAKIHPVLKTTGVSKITVDSFNGLVIFSKNGAKLTHGAITVKRSNNVVIRNLKFDEMWEWDESTKGNYDSNDWDYLTLEQCAKVWIDHCTFGRAYDGVLDVKKGTSGVTISWCRFDPASTAAGGFFAQMFDAMEASQSTYPMYKYIRGLGLTKADIMAIAAPQKKGHLVGANEFASDNVQLQVTLYKNYYKDMQDRIPRLRAGNVHVANVVVDSTAAYNAGKKITSAMATSLSGKGYHFGITSQAVVSTENGAVKIEKSLVTDVKDPLRNNQVDAADSTYTGKISVVGTTFTLDGAAWTPSPVPATAPAFSWNNGGLNYTLPTLAEPSTLVSRLNASNGSGAAKVSLDWLALAY